MKRCSICGDPTENLQEPILCDFCIEELDKLFEQQRDELWRDSYELAEF